MVEPGLAAERPSKRAKNVAHDQGPDLQATALLKYSLKLPQSFTPAAVQSNRVALRVVGDGCVAYVANAQHLYEVSLGSDLDAARSPYWSGVDQGKEGVLVPRSAEAGHVRQLDLLSYMAAEVQGLYAGVHGEYHVLAVTDAVGNARLLAEPLEAGGEERAEGGSGVRHVMSLSAPYRGECGWTGLAVRPAAADPAPSASPADCPSSAPPVFEVAVARQRLRDVVVYRDGAHMRSLHTMQGPTALTYLPPGPFGGSADAGSGLLAVAEEHQVSLWDVRQGERGGCVQRLGVYGGGSPVYGLSWVSPGAGAGAGGRTRLQGSGGGGGGGGGEGLLAATGGERSVVMLEPRKWHVVAKWPGCVKYPATHMAPSALAPGFVYVAGLDYECVAGRWDGSCGSSTGNANSSSGGHGRAMGPAQLLAARDQQQQGHGQKQEEQKETIIKAAAMDEGLEAGTSGRGGLSFRGDSKWLGLAACRLPPWSGAAGSCRAVGRQGQKRLEAVAALSLSGNMYVMMATAAPEVADV